MLVSIGGSGGDFGRWLDRSEPEPFLVGSAIVLAAAFHAGNFFSQRADAGEDGRACGAGIEKFAPDFPAFERDVVAARLVGDSQIPAGRPPLRSVRCDAVSPGAVLGQEMRQLVPQRFLDFAGRELHEFGIQGDPSLAPACETGGCPESGIPADCHLEPAAIGGTQKLVRKVLQQRVLTQSRASPRLFEIVGRSLDPPHHGPSKIQKQLMVFHRTVSG